MPRPNKRSMAAKKRQAELRSTEMQSKRSLVGNALDELGSSDKVGRPCEAQPISKNLPIPSNTFQYPPIPSNTLQYLPKTVKTCQNLPTIVPEYPTNQPTVTNSVKECVCITEPCVPERSVLMGSFHQGHARFGNARNKQCGAISLTAVLMCKIKSVLTWEPEDLDEVLVQGTPRFELTGVNARVIDGSTQMNNASSCTTSSANCLPVYSDVMKETWLNVDTEEEPQLPGYVFKHNPRGNCYDDSEPAFAALKPQQRVTTGHL
ncbi:uncharacterized protein LOC121700824 [Alosa sapidissima]|uniref:uncharacterized protein LOC121700823 n=1 Tax=Alosa sapidissima TaxID=34773 RepID=UPI001C09B0FF|nr:uncharacterized protein LOC121700823 [Alosa sapidissima]XP_041939981.1 uncharacterized protein LOC121700824 [Alosa sapidissima]